MVGGLCGRLGLQLQQGAVSVGGTEVSTGVAFRSWKGRTSGSFRRRQGRQNQETHGCVLYECLFECSSMPGRRNRAAGGRRDDPPDSWRGTEVAKRRVEGRLKGRGSVSPPCGIPDREHEAAISRGGDEGGGGAFEVEVEVEVEAEEGQRKLSYM